jgi:hypothetical protein
MVKRLRLRPLTAATGVRVPLGVPVTFSFRKEKVTKKKRISRIAFSSSRYSYTRTEAIHFLRATVGCLPNEKGKESQSIEWSYFFYASKHVIIESNYFMQIQRFYRGMLCKLIIKWMIRL